MKELTKKNYKCTDEQLDEIHQALKLEFSAVSKKQTEQKIKLYNGIQQQILSERYIYKFDPPNEPEKTIEPDKPYILSIDGEAIRGSIFAVSERYVEIELWKNYGRTIQVIDIIVDLRILIDLVDRRIVSMDREPEKYNLGNSKYLFDPHEKEIERSPKLNFDHSGRGDGISLNDEQISAIVNSINRKLSLIWGPSGTGKTRTLQGVIAEFLKRGKRVLFASNTNNAIDGLLLNLANKENTPYEYFNQLRSEGKIIRIGSQTNETVAKVFSPHAVAEVKSEKILSQITHIESRITEEKTNLAKYEEEVNQYNRAIQLKQKLEDLSNSLTQIESDEAVLSEINSIKSKRDLIIGQNKIVQKFDLKDVTKLNDWSRKLNQLKNKIEGIQAQLTAIEKEIASIYNNISTLNNDIYRLENKRFKKYLNRNKINELRKTLNEENKKLISLNSKVRLYNEKQREMIEKEATGTGLFLQEFKKFKGVLNKDLLGVDSLNEILRLINLSIKITGERPEGFKYACNLGACTEDDIDIISFSRGFASIDQAKIDTSVMSSL